MLKCFIEMPIPCLEDIQREILNVIPADYEITKIRGHNINKVALKENCPILYNWLVSNSKKMLDPSRPVKVYFSPPNTGLKPHIDLARSPISLNIPILNVKGTQYVFYNTPEENLEKAGDESNVAGLNLTNGLTAIDDSKMTLLDTLELTEPHLMRTHVLHGVINRTNKTRIIICITWASNSLKFEDYINLNFSK
jgi:hypothetical protein